MEQKESEITDCTIQNQQQNSDKELFQMGGIVFEMMSKPFGQFKEPRTFQKWAKPKTSTELRDEYGIYPKKKLILDPKLSES